MNTGESRARCPSAEDLSAYVDGELAAEARLGVARHLKTCARCREQAQELERASAGLRRVFHQAAREIDAGRAVTTPAGAATLRLCLLAGLALAAVVLVVLTLVLLLPSDVPDTPLHQPGPESTAEVPVPVPEEEAVEVLFVPSGGPLRAETMSLARAGDVDARIALSRMGLAGVFLLAQADPVPAGPPPSLEEREEVRRRFFELTERVLGGERCDEHSDEDSSGPWPFSHWLCWEPWPVPAPMLSRPSRSACWATT